MAAEKNERQNAWNEQEYPDIKKSAPYGVVERSESKKQNANTIYQEKNTPGSFAHCP